MPTIVQGELTRHHDQPFYAQQQRPKLFWGGCLGPVVLLFIVSYFVIRGLLTASGLDTVRLFIMVVLGIAVIQLIFGGTIFARTRSSLGKGLLIGAGLVVLLLILGLIGAASFISSFIR